MNTPPPLKPYDPTIVVTEQPYFADAVQRFIVPVTPADAARVRLFFRKTDRSDPRSRPVDVRDDDQPGRSFTQVSIASHEQDAAHGLVDDIPETRMESFDAFLAAIGYDWRSNSYSQAALPLAA